MKLKEAVNDVFWYNSDMVYLKRTAAMILVAIAIILVTLGIVLFGRGYRFNFSSRSLGSKGILVANSAPNNAQIYVNGKFMGLTSDNLYLSPGVYDIMVKKEGYTTWQKRFPIKGEVVSRVDAQMFSANPSLSPLTNNGVINPFLSPSRTRISYLALPDEINLTEGENDGLMLSNLTSGNLSFFRQHNQLVPYSVLPPAFDSTQTKFVFSTDEKNMLVFFSDENENLTSVIYVSTNNGTGEFSDVTLYYQEFLDKWWSELNKLQEKQYDALGKVRKVLNNNTYLIEVSPDKTKFLYFALSSATLPRTIKPPLIGSVPTAEERELKSGHFYVYDKKEDKNFRLEIGSEKSREKQLSFLETIIPKTSLSENEWSELNSLFSQVVWYSDSRHLVFSHADTISIAEYDGANKILVYSGPFEPQFLATSSDGRIVILTNINPKKNHLPDLYSVSIK